MLAQRSDFDRHPSPGIARPSLSLTDCESWKYSFRVNWKWYELVAHAINGDLQSAQSMVVDAVTSEEDGILMLAVEQRILLRSITARHDRFN